MSEGWLRIYDFNNSIDGLTFFWLLIVCFFFSLCMLFFKMKK